jgi:hypothetical protein
MSGVKRDLAMANLTWSEIVISGLIIPTCLQSVPISGHGMWLTQEPQHRFIYFVFTVTAEG